MGVDSRLELGQIGDRAREDREELRDRRTLLVHERARLAQQPRGEVAVGVGPDGKARSSLKLEVTSDFIMGRDPSAVYDSCVYQKSGQVPSRPLYSFPEWKG